MKKLPTIIQSTTRMIENSDVWRVNLGNLDQNEILSFTLSITNDLLADIDVLIMESSEADKYVLGQQSTLLGHASLINTGSLDTWDYTFPDAGAYSLIIDNSESPEEEHQKQTTPSQNKCTGSNNSWRLAWMVSE